MAPVMSVVLNICLFGVFLISVQGHRGKETVCYNVFPLMTLSNGAPVDDKTTTMTVGPVGPVVLQDLTLIEELAHLNREKIPERIGHAKGAGAYGYFEVTDVSFTQFCKASLFEAVGKKTKVVVRFSTGTQESGSCDTVRSIRGTAVKFYTDDGNWDLVGNNSPIFLVRDPMLVSSVFHILKRHPVTHLSDPDMFWDFVTLRPETCHQIMRTFSDLGTPDGYRYMNLYGTHTFKVVNREGMPAYCKFHFKTNQGVKNLDAAEALRLCGTDPDYAIRDLYNNIATKNYPSWTMYYQIMTFDQATKFKWNPFDITKIWPEKDYPLYEMGRLVLDRNPTNYFADVEQAAFSPSHLVPGIEPSPDKMLQARMFAYPDAHRYRLGVNYQQLPVNSPFKVTVANNMRDGRMCFGNNQGSTPNYYPTTIPDGAKVCPAASNTQWIVTGDVARFNTDNEDNYGQVTTFWSEVLDESQRQRLVTNLVESLKCASQPLQDRAVAMFKNVADDLASRIQQVLLIA